MMAMREETTLCKNCQEELASHTSLRRQLCQQEYVSKIAKKWGLISTIALTIFFATTVSMAYAQEEIQLWDGTGNPIILPNQSPAVLTLKAGEFIHGQVNQAEQVTSTLQNFMTSSSFDGTTTFQGVVPSYQTSLTIGQQQIVIIPA